MAKLSREQIQALPVHKGDIDGETCPCCGSRTQHEPLEGAEQREVHQCLNEFCQYTFLLELEASTPAPAQQMTTLVTPFRPNDPDQVRHWASRTGVEVSWLPDGFCRLSLPALVIGDDPATRFLSEADRRRGSDVRDQISRLLALEDRVMVMEMSSSVHPAGVMHAVEGSGFWISIDVRDGADYLLSKQPRVAPVITEQAA